MFKNNAAIIRNIEDGNRFRNLQKDLDLYINSEYFIIKNPYEGILKGTFSCNRNFNNNHFDIYGSCTLKQAVLYFHKHIQNKEHIFLRHFPEFFPSTDEKYKRLIRKALSSKSNKRKYYFRKANRVLRKLNA